MERQIYLDNNATTPLDPAVVKALQPYLYDRYGNASSVHHKGVEAEQAIDAQRRLIAHNLNVSPGEIYFTSGGTESNNLVLQGSVRRGMKKKQHIVTTAIEHSSVREVIDKLESRKIDVTRILPDEKGRISVGQITGALREETVLVSVMHVNNETGAILPVEDIGKAVHNYNSDITFHVDGVQAFGKYPVDLTYIDAYTFSGHKIHAPKGIGGLYIDEKCYVEPLLYGGGQESGVRSGTENVPGIVGLGKATELMFAEREKMLERLSSLRNLLVERLDGIADVHLNTSLEHSLPSTLNVSFPPVPGEVIVNGMSEKGVCISSGSACNARRKAKSHVLAAMGLEEKYIESSIRFSFSRQTGKTDINETFETLKELLPRLKKIARLQS